VASKLLQTPNPVDIYRVLNTHQRQNTFDRHRKVITCVCAISIDHGCRFSVVVTYWTWSTYTLR